MLDVHPPHEPTHSWKDFFVHIATIVVGLLIAVGIEQTVEAIHHHHQREELRESLHRESEQVLHDATTVARSQQEIIRLLMARQQAVNATLWNGEKLPSASAPAWSRFVGYPADAQWTSAKASGLTNLLTPAEVNAYNEIEILCDKDGASFDDWTRANNALRTFESGLPMLPHGFIDFSRADRSDLRQYQTLLLDLLYIDQRFLNWNEDIIGAEGRILANDLNLEDIYAAEKQSRSDLPSTR